MGMLDEPERPETRGLTLAALTLAIGTISRFQTKGFLNQEDIERIFGGALSSMEDFLPPDDRAATVARGLLDALHGIALVQSRKPATGQ